ncbi:MAG: CPBP family glutamic-type intramembrane protease [Candidatus Helarchaeota archaeon]
MKEQITKKRVIILCSTIFLTIIYYFTSLFYVRVSPTQKNIVFFHLLFSGIIDNVWIDYWQYIFQFFMAFLLFFVIPLLILKYYFKEKIEDYGMQLGDKKFNAIWTIIGAALLPLIFFVSNSPDIMNEYPLTRLVLLNGGLFISFSVIYFVYYLGYEFFFRGYLQFGLKEDDTGKLGIILILTVQTTITTLFHIGKPLMEIIPAAIIGPIFGYLTLKGKSIIWPVLIFHYALGVLTNCVVLVYG